MWSRSRHRDGGPAGERVRLQTAFVLTRGEPVWTFAGRAARMCADTGRWPHQVINRRPGHSQVGRNSVPSVTMTLSFCYRVGWHPPASPSPLTTVCAICTARRVTAWSPSNSLYPKCHHQFTDAGQNLHGMGHPVGAA